MKKIITLFALATCFTTNAQIISTVAGTGVASFSGDGAAATSATLHDPYRVTVDPTGNIYIADNLNNRIRKVNTSGIISTIAGTAVQGFSGDGGAAVSAELYTPTGVVLDAASMGDIYICDEDNMRIRKINSAGIITTVAGNGTGGFSGDGGAATSAKLLRPYEMTINSVGDLYIVDSQNNRIRKVTTAGIISTIVGNGTAGFSGDGGAATAAEINQPSGIAVDGVGNIYIADTYNNRIRMVNGTTGVITTLVGNGTAGFGGDGGIATSAQINYPRGVAIAGNSLFIADEGNNRIRKVTNSGIISTVAGSGTAGFSGDGGLATAANLNNPCGVSFDVNGNMYIADLLNNRIRKVTNVVNAIDQASAKSELMSVYPNPAKGSFVIETNSKKSQAVNVFDINGKVVLSQNINGTTTIDASSLSDGVYTVSIKTEEGTVTKKLIIQK